MLDRRQCIICSYAPNVAWKPCGNDVIVCIHSFSDILYFQISKMTPHVFEKTEDMKVMDFAEINEEKLSKKMWETPFIPIGRLNTTYACHQTDTVIPS